MSDHLLRARPAQLAVVVGGCAALVWLLFLWHVDPADLSVFLRAGRSVRDGATPYVDPNSPAVWSGHAFVYPYAVAVAFVPLSALPVSTAAVLYYLASIAALVVVARVLGGRDVPLWSVAALLTAEPVVRALQLGTLNVWLLLGLALAWWRRHDPVALVLILTVVIVAKLFLLPMLAWLVLTRRLRVAAATAALSVAAVVAGCWIVALDPSAFLQMLSRLSEHEASHSSSVTSWMEHLGLGRVAAGGLALVVAGLVIFAGWVRSRRRQDEASLFCACVIASLAASPIVWSHYFSLLAVIPLALRWSLRSQLFGWALTWLIWQPRGVAPLNVLHPFPGSGWLWAGIVVLSAAVYLRRPARRTAVP